MSKRYGTFSFSYSKRNYDVLELMENKSQDESFVRTDYFCEAVRFYEKYKNSLSSIDENKIRNMIIEVIQSNAIDGMQIDQLTNQIKVSKDVNLESINDDWLMED